MIKKIDIPKKVCSDFEGYSFLSMVNLAVKQNNIFRRNHFLASFGGHRIIDYHDTTIKYRRNKLSDDKLIKEFLYLELINKPDFPELSSAAKNEIIRSIFEIYSNAIIHGGCTEVYSCGQFYPQKFPPRIDFTIVDIGRTIKRNVSEFLKKDISGNAIYVGLEYCDFNDSYYLELARMNNWMIVTDDADLFKNNHGNVSIITADIK